MDWRVKRNRRYLLAIVIFFFVIPHIFLCLPYFPSLVNHSGECYRVKWLLSVYKVRDIYYLLVWVGVPLSGGIIALRHVLEDGGFSPPLVITAALSILSQLLRGVNLIPVLVLLCSAVVVLVMEFFAFLGHCAEDGAAEKRPAFLLDAARNSKFLARVCFRSVVLLCVLQISRYCSFEICGGRLSFLMPVSNIFISLFVAFLPMKQGAELEKDPLTKGGLTVLLILYLLSALLSSVLYMWPWWINLICITIGYGLLALDAAIPTPKLEK